MKIIKTHELSPLTLPSSQTELLWLYNGLDCCVTAEVLDRLVPQLDPTTRATYSFSRGLQGPVLDMRLRGVLVDQSKRADVIDAYRKDLKRLEAALGRILFEGVGLIAPLNWRSPLQLKRLFYEILKLPPIKKRNSKNSWEPSVDREALERLAIHFLAEPIVNHILCLRDIGKKIGVLETDIDPDGRMRTSYNIAGTTTGRFSSSLSDFGSGTNLQNIEERLRSVFVADLGFKFAYIDLEQAESRLVGAIEWNLFKDGRYLDACESGDLHTTVCKLAWSSLDWTQDTKRNREIAERPFYRQHSYRHMAKVLGHGTNYSGTPRTMSKHTKLDARIISVFQNAYFTAFPAHQRWHAHVASTLLRDGFLVSLTGRKRWFFGRRNDDATVREAIAFDPQGSVGDILNQAMLKVWQLNNCQLLLQIHDAILVQFPEELEHQVVPKLIETMTMPIQLKHDRTFAIPCEAKTGFNWAPEGPTNPDGLTKYQRGSDGRRRSEHPKAFGLDQILGRV